MQDHYSCTNILHNSKKTSALELELGMNLLMYHVKNNYLMKLNVIIKKEITEFKTSYNWNILPIGISILPQDVAEKRCYPNM